MGALPWAARCAARGLQCFCIAAIIYIAGCGGCSKSPTSPSAEPVSTSRGDTPAGASLSDPTPSTTLPAPPAAPAPPLVLEHFLMGAGDIGECGRVGAQK